MLISPYTAPQLATEKNAGADKSGTRRKSCTFGIELFGMERAIIAADKTETKRMRHNSSILTHSSPAAFTITNRNVPPTPLQFEMKLVRREQSTRKKSDYD